MNWEWVGARGCDWLDSQRNCRSVARCVLGAVLAGASAFAATSGTAGELQTWTQAEASEFRAGRPDNLIVSEDGSVRLAHQGVAFPEFEAARVWDLLERPDGAILAATGDEGRVLKLEPGAETWTTAIDLEDSQALALACLPDGTAVVGTGPGGRVLELDHDNPEGVRIADSVRYVWDLAADEAGRLYAATGPKGEVWVRDEQRRWSRRFSSRDQHLLAAAVDDEGSVYVGGTEGVLYRIDEAGQARVVYDAPQAEIRSIRIAQDGAVYFGTATSGSKSARRLAPRAFGSPVRFAAFEDQAAALPIGSADLEEIKPETNVLYRVVEGQGPRVVHETNGDLLAIAEWNGSIAVGTGAEASVIQLAGPRGVATPLERFEAGQVLALAVDSDSRLLVGTGARGSVRRLSPKRVERGTLASDVLDATLRSRFGALEWEAELPEGTAIEAQLRTGDVGRPDATWSDWSEPITDPGGASSDRPAGRFAQWRLRLSTDDPTVTPVLKSVSVHYQSLNLPPEIRSIEPPEPVEAEDAARASRVRVTWSAADPNEDELEFVLELRKDDWPDWVTLAGPIPASRYEWNAASLPSGRYRLRLTATDRRSNRPEDAFEESLESERFLIDHERPKVALRKTEQGVEARVSDDHARVTEASYAIDGGDWTPVFPTDGLFDTKTETIQLTLDDLEPGAHVLVLRAQDQAGNVGAADLVLTVEEGADEDDPTP